MQAAAKLTFVCYALTESEFKMAAATINSSRKTVIDA